VVVAGRASKPGPAWPQDPTKCGRADLGDGDSPADGEELDVGDARMVIDGPVQAVPADALVPVHVTGPARDPMPQAGDPSELLGIEMEQIPSVHMFITLAHRRGGPAPPPRHTPAPHPARRGCPAPPPRPPPPRA